MFYLSCFFLLDDPSLAEFLTSLYLLRFCSGNLKFFSIMHLKILLKVKESKVLSCVQLFVTLWTVARQSPLSMRFFQARLLEWVAISFSRGSSWPRDRTLVSYIAGRLLTGVWDSRLSDSYCLSHQGSPKFF